MNRLRRLGHSGLLLPARAALQERTLARSRAADTPAAAPRRAGAEAGAAAAPAAGAAGAAGGAAAAPAAGGAEAARGGAAGPRRAESLAEWASREEALKTPLNVGDVEGTLKRYMTPGAEGAELRAAHGAAARQYSKVYGYTVATFVVAALVALALKGVVELPNLPSAPEQRDKQQPPRGPTR
jgi:hypothetical protein